MLHFKYKIHAFVVLCTPLSVWPHLFRGAGRQKRRGEPIWPILCPVGR